MGNRAVITTKEAFENDGIGVYLHWNGGRDSVEGFLKYCEIKKYAAPTEDEQYGFARLTQVIANFFGGKDSIGIGNVKSLDCNNWDNGTYIIEGWKIVGRKYFENGIEQKEYELDEFVKEVNRRQPEGEQIKEDDIDKLLKEEK